MISTNFVIHHVQNPLFYTLRVGLFTSNLLEEVTKESFFLINKLITLKSVCLGRDQFKCSFDEMFLMNFLMDFFFDETF